MFGRKLFNQFRKSNFQAHFSRAFNTENIWARENIPFYGTLVGLTAFSFQVAVLYPWHHELSSEFGEIQVMGISFL
jgi:formate-dependent nitrite reductase membrane component NrfD